MFKIEYTGTLSLNLVEKMKKTLNLYRISEMGLSLCASVCMFVNVVCFCIFVNIACKNSVRG